MHTGSDSSTHTECSSEWMHRVAQSQVMNETTEPYVWIPGCGDAWSARCSWDPTYERYNWGGSPGASCEDADYTRIRCPVETGDPHCVQIPCDGIEHGPAR